MSRLSKVPLADRCLQLRRSRLTFTHRINSSRWCCSQPADIVAVKMRSPKNNSTMCRRADEFPHVAQGTQVRPEQLSHSVSSRATVSLVLQLTSAVVLRNARCG